MSDPLQIALFGPTGGTGQRLTAQAIDADHKIHALTRSPEKLQRKREVRVIEGNVLDSEAVKTAVEGTGAVVCVLGRTPNNPRDVVSRGTENIIGAMIHHSVERLIVLTSMGIGASAQQVPWYVRLANATVLSDLMSDKARQEELVMSSGLDWTIVRPGGLTDGPRTGEYVHGYDIDATAGPISRANVAEFLLWVLREDAYRRELPVLTTREGVTIDFLHEQAAGIANRLC